MKGITIPTISMPVISMPSIGVPWIGVPDSGKKGLAWPSGMKEAIKAVYDPKKQGMANYDVIETYTEDFSKRPWNNKKEKYTGTLTPNTLTVTNVAVTSALIYTNSKPENFKVYITGIKDNQQVIFGNDVSAYRALIVEKDGVYDVNWEDNQSAYCIWCNFLGECDITIKQLPTSILQDLSGNGNHAYLYGGKGKLNSGMGVYGIDVTENIIQQNRFEYLYDNITKEVTFVKALAAGTYLFFINKNIVNSTQQIKIAGIDRPIHFVNSTTNETYYSITEDGIYDIDFVTDADTVIRTSYTTNQELNLRVQFLPYYPNQLCYDGKMYAVCYGFPILTDYTVMADRTWFELTANSAFISKAKTPNNGAFIFELYQEREHVLSFGQYNDVSFENGVITYQTKNTYNGTNIQSGSSSDENVLYIGKIRDNTTAGFNGCHGKIIIADRSFTKDEITWLKDNWEKI
ncbi:hypothetical protein [Bacteroides gallinarum]|uniref:hypothetical protein n=1 Tax=Bacteroides gallinarum TaxID=376806 RepID=UPI0003722967|nr:hypothetical protein [Bacteroides gallinarum]